MKKEPVSLWPLLQSWTGKACMFARAQEEKIGTKWTSYLDSGHSKTSENGFNGILPQVSGSGQILRPKKMTLLLPYTPSEPISSLLSCQTPNWTTFQILMLNLIGVICNPSSWVWVCKPWIMIHCHRFTLNGSFCALIYAITSNIFAILILGSYFHIKKELIVYFSVFLANY